MGGVAPGSFLGLLLAARNKQTGEALTDNQVRASCVMTNILQGAYMQGTRWSRLV